MRDPVVVTAGNGVKDIPASAAAKTKTIKPGDLLGFYIPANAAGVIAVDYIAASPNEPVTLGGSTWGEGQQVSFPDIYATLARAYSLNADCDPNTGPLPEPTTIVALVSGLCALALRRKK